MKPWSLSRYLLLKIFLPALVVNVVVNDLAGKGIFPPGQDVPLYGKLSVAGDTLGGSFLIGLFSAIGVVPAARLEARSGRVRGFGSKARWLAWAHSHVFPTALGLGVLLVALVGVPVVKALEARGITSIGRDDFVLFKASYAGVVGLLAVWIAALVGLAPEPPVSADARWCQDAHAPVGGPVYPMEYMDKAALAVTDRARGATGTPTWELRVAGELDPAHVRTALADAVTRYPSLATRVQSLDGVPPHARMYRYAFDPAFRVERVFEVVDARGDAARLAATTRELRSRHLDLFTDFPVTLTQVLVAPGESRLVFRQHHAIADGRAFIAMLVDFAAYLNHARAGHRPPPETLAPIGRRGELDALGLSPARRALFFLGGIRWLLSTVLRAIATPLVPLHQNLGNDYSGENATVHWVVGDGVLDAWNAARKRLGGVSLNTLLTGALFLANQRWHRARGLPVGRTNAQLLMETRPRGREFVSFANHLAFLDSEADLGKSFQPEALLASLQAQVVQQRDRDVPVKRLLLERLGVLLLPLAQLQTMIFESKRPAYNLNFSNLIPLEFAPLEGDGWAVREVLITTPVAPRHGIVLTVIRYRGRLAFNFNCKTTAATVEETRGLCEEFRAVMREMTGSEGEAIEV
jgi:hypothetical protein